MIHRQSAEQLASSESELIMHELAARSRANRAAGNRTFEDDDEEVANAIPEPSNIDEPSLEDEIAPHSRDRVSPLR